jgi:Fe-S-cluster containining protein
MLESLTPQQIEVVVERARSWLLRFQMSGLGRRNRPPATEYRAEYLWCPFLEGGKCMAYDRRPLACRAHFALESADGCIQDHLRSRQLFALFPEMGETLVSARCRELEDGESATWDHLGLLVSKILLGVDEPSAIRTLATARGDTLELQTYTDEAVKE